MHEHTCGGGAIGGVCILLLLRWLHHLPERVGVRASPLLVGHRVQRFVQKLSSCRHFLTVSAEMLYTKGSLLHHPDVADCDGIDQVKTLALQAAVAQTNTPGGRYT
jgi:hypothetical protein